MIRGSLVVRWALALVPLVVAAARLIAPTDLLLIAGHRRQGRSVLLRATLLGSTGWPPSPRPIMVRLHLTSVRGARRRLSRVDKRWRTTVASDYRAASRGDCAVVKRRTQQLIDQPSWSGEGQLRFRTQRERTTLIENVVLVVGALAVNVVVYAIASLFGAQTRIVCGYHCFPSPAADLHDARVRLWAVGIAVVITVGAAFLIRRGRLLVTLVQGAILAAVLIYTIPTMIHAHDQLRELQRCDYGRHGPCVGVRDLGTPTGT